jgi:hypothetical protein
MARLNRMEHAARQRLVRLERQAKAREEDAALEASLTQALERGEDQGAEFDRQPQRRGEGRKPIRRLTGLEWLHRKERISDDQLAAGERYGATYRRAKGDIAIRSILNRDVTGSDGCTIAAMLANAEASVYAKEKLAMYRGQLANQAALIDACDAVCGNEQTPREASENGRGAEAIEALLMVALDLLIQHLAPARTAEPQNVAVAA